jgi:hypothetical protein
MDANLNASPRFHDTTQRPPAQRLVLLCDWLPPDFGAVGQYTLQRGEQLASEGHHVTVVGFATRESSASTVQGLTVQRVVRGNYNKASLIARASWTLRANFMLLWAARRAIKRADEVIFTGSPPYFLHFIVPINALFWRKKLVYRITDFHPECLMAEYPRSPLWLRAIYQLTLFWRRKVAVFEAIGEDQKVRLADIGVSEQRMRLVRDPAPVAFASSLVPMVKPAAITRHAILYSGNFGVAHDHETFLAGYALFLARYPARATLWLNAVGKKADVIQRECASKQLPVHRSMPVPLAQLPSLLLAADVHLITLRDAFVGYVLPSKVYACIESAKNILFIGSGRSDVHLLCAARLGSNNYQRVDVGDSEGVAQALHTLLPE